MRFVYAMALAAAMPLVAMAETASPSSSGPARMLPTGNQATPDAAQTTSLLMRSNGGSLLRASLAAQPDPSLVKASSVSFFAVPPPVPHVLRKHDLVTLIVREESESSSEGNTDLKKEADLDAKIEQFIRFSLDEGSIENIINGPPPEIKMSGKRNFKGEATVDRTDSLILRIQAEIIDVKPNNTLVLQARASIQTDEETQTMILSGICRAEDVTADNTVLSTQLYDKSVTKTHTGSVRDTTKRGWVSRILDMLNPF